MPSKLDKIDDAIRSGVVLIAKIGGFDEDYHAVINAKYKNDMFLRDLTRFINEKKYKLVITLLKEEYPFMIFERENGVISEDEKLLRRFLRPLGYSDDDFFNPKYDKEELITWNDPRDKQDHLFRVESVFIDSGAYFYNLRDLESGVHVGGRVRENELKEPTALQKIIYYKKRGMLDVHLFNQLAFISSDFDFAKCKIERENYSATQGAVRLFYDGKEIYNGCLDAGKMRIEDGKFVFEKTDKYWLDAIQKVYEEGDEFYNGVAPLKNNYGLKEKLLFLEALKGVDNTKGLNKRICEISNIAQQGYIDKVSHYNVLAMLSHDTNAPIKLPSDNVSVHDINEIETLAIRKLKNDSLGEQLQKKLNKLKKEPLVKEKLFDQYLIKNDNVFKSGKIYEDEISKFSGRAWHVCLDHELGKEINKFCNDAYSFVMERDILKLQRPDLEALIRSADLYLDGSREDLVIFRGAGRNRNYEWDTIEASLNQNVNQSWAELKIADNGYRREFYFAPTDKYSGGANMGYCEGDLSLVVPKDKIAFESRLESGIKFHMEDMNIDNSRFDEIKKEISLKLGLVEECTVQDFSKRHDETYEKLDEIIVTTEIPVKDYL